MISTRERYSRWIYHWRCWHCRQFSYEIFVSECCRKISDFFSFRVLGSTRVSRGNLSNDLSSSATKQTVSLQTNVEVFRQYFIQEFSSGILKVCGSDIWIWWRQRPWLWIEDFLVSRWKRTWHFISFSDGDIGRTVMINFSLTLNEFVVGTLKNELFVQKFSSTESEVRTLKNPENKIKTIFLLETCSVFIWFFLFQKVFLRRLLTVMNKLTPNCSFSSRKSDNKRNFEYFPEETNLLLIC